MESAQDLLSSAPRGFAARSRILARLVSLAQIGELARRLRLDLTENFHHEHFIDPTNCPWVSEDAPVGDTR